MRRKRKIVAIHPKDAFAKGKNIRVDWFSHFINRTGRFTTSYQKWTSGEEKGYETGHFEFDSGDDMFFFAISTILV
jgi:hypothetical protein